MFMIQNIDYFCSYIGRKVVAKSSLKSQTESSPCSIFIGFCHLDSVHRGKQEWNPTCKKRNHVICTEHSNYNKHLIRSNAFSNGSGGCMIVGIIWAFHFFVGWYLFVNSLKFFSATWQKVIVTKIFGDVEHWLLLKSRYSFPTFNKFPAWVWGFQPFSSFI